MGLFQFWKQGPTLPKRSKDQTLIKDLISYKLKYRTKVGPGTRDEPLSAFVGGYKSDFTVRKIYFLLTIRKTQPLFFRVLHITIRLS